MTFKPDPSIMLSGMFAKMLRAYLECSDEVQGAIREMVDVVNAGDVTEDERESALATIAEALFPICHNGDLGICLEDSERTAAVTLAAPSA